jgi:hypothetical protein
MDEVKLLPPFQKKKIHSQEGYKEDPHFIWEIGKLSLCKQMHLIYGSMGWPVFGLGFAKHDLKMSSLGPS